MAAGDHGAAGIDVSALFTDAIGEGGFVGGSSVVIIRYEYYPGTLILLR